MDVLLLGQSIKSESITRIVCLIKNTLPPPVGVANQSA